MPINIPIDWAFESEGQYAENFRRKRTWRDTDYWLKWKDWSSDYYPTEDPNNPAYNTGNLFVRETEEECNRYSQPYKKQCLDSKNGMDMLEDGMYHVRGHGVPHYAGTTQVIQGGRRKSKNKFVRRVEQILNNQFPLNINVQGIPSNAHTSQIDASCYVMINPMMAWNPRNGSGINTLNLTGETDIWFAQPFGVGSSQTDFNMLQQGAVDTSCGWGQFISFQDNVITTRSYVELMFEKDCIWMAKSDGLPKLNIVAYTLLIPCANIASAMQANGEVLFDTVKNYVVNALGSNFLERTRPTRLNKERQGVVVINATRVKNVKGTGGGFSWGNFSNNSVSPSVDTNIAKPVVTTRHETINRFKYGKNGLRFYVLDGLETSQLLEWIPTACRNSTTKFFFLGRDRTTPYIPVRICRLKCIQCAIDVNQEAVVGATNATNSSLLNMKQFSFTMGASCYTWCRVQDTNNRVGPPSDVFSGKRRFEEINLLQPPP